MSKQASMERFFKKTSKQQPSNTNSNTQSSSKRVQSDANLEESEVDPESSSKRVRLDRNLEKTQVDLGLRKSSERGRLRINLEDLKADPGLRKKILEYHPDDHDAIRMKYILEGPYQPRNHNFPPKLIGNKSRKFCPSWYVEFSNWLEYSIKKDAVYCLCCYLFKPPSAKGTGDAFTSEGFSSWNKKERLREHVGGINSAHNKAWKSCLDLANRKQHIDTFTHSQSDQMREIYRIRLTAVVDCLTSSEIQKDIVNAAAAETTLAILKELGNECFAIIVDESRDISKMEQMAVGLRFVNEKGSVMERFLGMVHVRDTCSLSLKGAIDSLLSKHGLSLSRIRGQGYDGASNMRGELKGLKTLIMQDNPSAFYIHCFAHQLQLTLVSVASEEDQVQLFFDEVAKLINVVGSSCKRVDNLRELQVKKVREALASGEIQSGQGLNQETSLRRPGDTRWSSHYNSLQSIIGMYSSIIGVLEIIDNEGVNGYNRYEARGLLRILHTFEFSFTLHMMRDVLAITHGLSQTLQRKDQDIVNAMNLLRLSKQELQKMRDSGWETLLDEVSSFCKKYDIEVPDMNEVFFVKGKRRKEAEKLNIDQYRAGWFYVVLDKQLQELNDRFSETSTELLLCMACLSPGNSFAAFDKQKLIRLGQLYPSDFSAIELMNLNKELDIYIADMRGSEDFCQINGIGKLAEELVETIRHLSYPYVYRLLKLALILPVATATVERVFSAMKIVKNSLRNRISDTFMNDCLVCYIERDVFSVIDNEVILDRFQKMKPRRGQL